MSADRTGTTDRSSELRIVVGVSYSEQGIAALQWAIGQAQLICATLHAVRAFSVPPLIPYSHTHRAAISDIREQITKSERHQLDAHVAPLRANTDVQITTLLQEGAPAPVLLSVAKGAELLVLGSPGTGALVGTLAGSTSYSVLRRARCPLVLITVPPEHPRHRLYARLSRLHFDCATSIEAATAGRIA